MNKLVIALAWLIPFGLIFGVFFSSSHLVWGDAPYFYPENMVELFSRPLIWNNRTDNFGSNQGLVLWLYFPTFLYGLLNKVSFFSNDILIRLIFYFPATLLAITGSYQLLKKYTKYSSSALLGSILFGFNSYFLLLIDGGQIGVALAYGIFPWLILSLITYLKQPTWKSYAWGMFWLAFISNVDIRLMLIGIFLAVLLQPRRFLSLLWFWPIILVDSFWLVPLISLPISSTAPLRLSQGFNGTKLIDSLSLFQTHFPLNNLNSLFPLPWYGLFLPVILGISTLFNRRGRKLGLLFLVGAFLAKGNSPPLGQLYDLAINHLPFGLAFRDGTKFYVMTLILGAILIGLLGDTIMLRLSLKKAYLIVVSLYLYLLILVAPALGTGLSGVLNKNFENHDPENQLVYQQLRTESGVRSLWFPEKLPLAFSSWKVPSLSADSLYRERPFASMITGTYDLYGYLNDYQLLPWLRLIGVKYVFFPNNPRQKVQTETDKIERSEFVDFVNNILSSQSSRLDLPYPAFVLNDPSPHLFTLPKINFVLGGDEIYNSLMSTNSNINLANYGLVFLEDPRVDITKLAQINPSDATITTVGDKSIDDVTMLYLKNQLLPDQRVIFSQWGKRSSEDYLDWKDQLRRQGVNSYDFGEGQSVYFSSIAGETLNYQINNPHNQNYYLAIRSVESSTSAGLKITVNGVTKIIHSKNNHQLLWQVLDPIKPGNSETISLTNLGGFSAISGVATFSEEQLGQARDQAQKLMNYFPSSDLMKPSSLGIVSFQMIDPTFYHVTFTDSNPWLIMTDHYDPSWQTNSSVDLPIYSMFNALYLPNRSSPNLDLVYHRQKQVDVALWVSLASLLILGLLFWRHLS